ncbi:MAG: HNH endonuclease [Bacteroidales bacterium]|jgi:hypothetical protein
MKFALKPDNRNASDKELLDDLKKVASELNKESLTQSEYDKVGRFNSGTIKKRLGWNNALEKAGLTVAKHQNISDEELLEDLKRVANKIAPIKVTTYKYNEVGKYSSTIIDRRFGWNKALKKAGLEISNLQNISNEELFENMEEIWIKLGRPPYITECVKPFSKYSSDTYTKRFGNWRKALETFVEYINSDDDKTDKTIIEEIVQQSKQGFKHLTKRNPSNKLKIRVAMRDGNVCRICGCKLEGWNDFHFDHIIPWVKCGETTYENLQILCVDCNLLKGSLDYPEK